MRRKTLNKSLFADISLLFVALVWGSTFVLVQNALSFLEPFSFNGVRFFLAGLLLFGWLCLFQRHQFTYINKRLIFSGMFIGFWLFLGYAFQTLGLLYTTSSKAGFITGLSVVIVPFLSYILLKQRPNILAIVGVFIATIGLYLLTMTDSASLNVGDAFVFICAAGFALHIIFIGKFSKQFPTLLLTAIQILTVAFLSSIFAFLFEDWEDAFRTDVLLTGEVIVALVITSIFATAVAFFIQTNFQKYTKPTRVALIFATEPVFAAATGYFWAGDRLSGSAIFGCLLILFGMIFAELPKKNMLFQRKNAM